MKQISFNCQSKNDHNFTFFMRNSENLMNIICGLQRVNFDLTFTRRRKKDIKPGKPPWFPQRLRSFYSTQLEFFFKIYGCFNYITELQPQSVLTETTSEKENIFLSNDRHYFVIICVPLFVPFPSLSVH